MQIRPVQLADAPALALLINDIIARGGTTAFQKAFTPETLAEGWLIGTAVICCFVAQDDVGVLQGFQMIVKSPSLPQDVGDIGTFARLDSTQRGTGTRLFEKTSQEARRKGLVAINATIRADNSGGLSFYTRLGFVDYAVTHAVPLDDGTPVDRVYKRYQL